MSLNKVQLIGNVGQEPQIRNFENGTIALFTLATTERGYKLQNGTEVPERTEWSNIVCNNKLVETIQKYVHKGDKLYVEGKLRTREYEKDGVKKYMTEIFMQNMEMLTPKAQSQPQQPNYQPQQNMAPQQAYQPQMGYQQPQQGFPYQNGQGYQPPYQPNGQAQYYPPQSGDPFAPVNNDPPF